MSPSITITTTNKEASMVYTTSYPSGSRTEWVDGVAIVPASVTGSIVIKTGKQSPGVAFGLETETFRKRTNAVEKFTQGGMRWVLLKPLKVSLVVLPINPTTSIRSHLSNTAHS